jgi:hypothetical protein
MTWLDWEAVKNDTYEKEKDFLILFSNNNALKVRLYLFSLSNVFSSSTLWECSVDLLMHLRQRISIFKFINHFIIFFRLLPFFKIDNLFVSVPYLVVTWPPLTKCFTSPQEKVIKNDQSNYLGQLWQVIQSIVFSVTYFVSSIWSFLFTSSAIFDRIHIFCEQSSVQSVSDFKCSSRCFCFLHFVEQLVTFGYKKCFFFNHRTESEKGIQI